MIRKKWWEKKAILKSNQWCVIRVEIGYYTQDRWDEQARTEYKPCHLSNVPTGSNLVCKSLTQHEAQSMAKLLNLES